MHIMLEPKFLNLYSESKYEYYNKFAMKFTNPKTNSKNYWSILTIFYNGRKITIISPLLKDGKLESDFKIKANHFNFQKKLLITLQPDLLQSTLTTMIFLKLSGL